MNPSYSVFIVSKGRWNSRLTSKSLEKMNMPYHIVVEPQEYDNYAEVINPKKILVLPFTNLGQGSIPARNWIWEYSIQLGSKRHWILDDNINGFERLNRNKRARVTSGTIFKCAEDFVDRYENVAFSGFEYRQFTGGARRKKPPFRLNTRIYSCILVNNSLPYRWRGRYNEDTDICIRALKDGWCTVMFNAFLQNKIGTMEMKGGNTDELYKDDGRLKMAQSLQEQHPDIVKIERRFNRWQHVVDYSSFVNNTLIKKEGLVIPDHINNYGMVLKEKD
jgi:hypothetical protein